MTNTRGTSVKRYRRTGISRSQPRSIEPRSPPVLFQSVRICFGSAGGSVRGCWSVNPMVTESAGSSGSSFVGSKRRILEHKRRIVRPNTPVHQTVNYPFAVGTLVLKPAGPESKWDRRRGDGCLSNGHVRSSECAEDHGLAKRRMARDATAGGCRLHRARREGLGCRGRHVDTSELHDTERMERP
jgi:hypothetical protein